MIQTASVGTPPTSFKGDRTHLELNLEWVFPIARVRNLVARVDGERARFAYWGLRPQCALDTREASKNIPVALADKYPVWTVLQVIPARASMVTPCVKEAVATKAANAEVKIIFLEVWRGYFGQWDQPADGGA